MEELRDSCREKVKDTQMETSASESHAAAVSEHGEEAKVLGAEWAQEVQG